jgi:PhoPQ-activated pathogenicity-related protein
MWLGLWRARLLDSVRTTHLHLDLLRRPSRRRLKAVYRRSILPAPIATLEALEDRVLLSASTSTLPTLTPAQVTALDTYVAAPDSSYGFSLNSKITGPGYTDYVVNLTSQTWSPAPGVSEVWQHWLQIIVPTNVTSKTAVLNIENGLANSNSTTPPTAADPYSVQIATTTNAITVFLPTVPNEPESFSGTGPLTEDPLVAYTLNQFLDGNGQDWPILLPMVKSAVATMNATQSFVASESSGALSVDNFIVTGQSKRGWTTWLTPAVDTRVVAIVPFVFDGLNLDENIANQLDTDVGVTQDIYDGDSTAVEPYATAFASLGTPAGQALDQIIDPYSYINRPTYDIPKYLIDSTGDQFFVPGAQFYFSSLPGENYLDYVPNTDHSLDAAAYTSGVDFEKAVIDGAALPQFTWNVTDGGTQIDLNTVSTPTSVTMWQATNPNSRDFRLETFGANWTGSILTAQGAGNYVAQVSLPSTGATAFFIQMQYLVDGMTLTFTTQISTVPLFNPTVAVIDAGGAYNGNPFSATATAIGEVGEPVAGAYAYEYFAGNTASGPSSATPPTTAGTYTVVALFTPTDPMYAHGQSAPMTFTISPLAPVVTATDIGGLYDGDPFAASATATGLNNASVSGGFTYTYYTGSTVSGNGSSTAPTNAGTYTVVASFTSDDPDYTNQSSAPVTFTIAAATPTVVAVDNGGTYDGDTFPATATPTGVGGATVSGNSTFTYYLGSAVSGTGSSTAPTNAGTYTVVASFASTNPNYGNAKSAPLTFTISPPALALYNGNYTGTYTGTSIVNNNGTITTTPVAATAYTAIIEDGVITVTIPGGSGTGTVDSQGDISGSVNIQIDGVIVAVPFTGMISAVGPAGTAAAGTWQYSANLGNGIVVSGNGSWGMSSAQVVTDFDGNYAGSYQGSVVVKSNGQTTTSAVAPTSFAAVLANGFAQFTYPSSSGLATGTGTIGANGSVTGMTSFVTNGVTVPVTFVGTATRSLSGVQATGTWSFTANLGNGMVESGQGTWIFARVLIFNASYAGNFSGTVVTNNNGTITTSSLPGSGVTNTSVQLAISNGVVTVSVPGVAGTGTGTIDAEGNITGTVTFQSYGLTVTVHFVGKAIQTTTGDVITGTWSYTENYGGGIVVSGSGVWDVSNTTSV